MYPDSNHDFCAIVLAAAESDRTNCSLIKLTFAAPLFTGNLHEELV